MILAVGALALLFPVLIFIGTATRLAAARREQRFAAMRLVGATPRQVSAISAVEAGVAAIAGVAVGFGLFFLARPVLTRFDFTGLPFAPGDLSLSSIDVLAVAFGVPVAAAIAARLALRRVRISPLGVTRRVTPSAPSAYRLIPLVAGIGELVYFVAIGQPKGTSAPNRGLLLGLLPDAGRAGPGRPVADHGQLPHHGRSGRATGRPAGRAPAWPTTPEPRFGPSAGSSSPCSPPACRSG